MGERERKRAEEEAKAALPISFFPRCIFFPFFFGSKKKSREFFSLSFSFCFFIFI